VPLNLRCTAEYFKNAKVYKLQIGHVQSAGDPGYMTLFSSKQIKGQGHTTIK